jgi:hypothetical protein
MRGQVLACAEQQFGRRASLRSGHTRDPAFQAKEEITWRAERRPLVVEIDRTSRMGGSPLGQSLPWRSPISSEAREGPRGPRHAEERLPRRPQTNRRWSLRVTCSWPLPPWAVEVGPAQHHFSRSGGSSLSTCAPRRYYRRLWHRRRRTPRPPFKGNTDMGKREGHIIAGTCRGKREQQPNDQADYGKAPDRKREPPNHERGTTRDEADDDGAERTCSNLKWNRFPRSYRRRTAMNGLRVRTVPSRRSRARRC